MAKKTALTPTDLAVDNARRVAELRAKIETLTDEKETLETALRAHMKEYPDTDLVHLKAEERASPAVIEGEGLTAKELDYAKSQLLLQHPEFGKQSLDAGKVWAAVKSNISLANAMNTLGLTVSVVKKWQFKVVK